LGLAAHAHLGHPAKLSIRIPHRLSFQRRQPPAAACRSSKWVALSHLRILNLGLEKKFAFRGYLWAARIEAVNIFDRLNPDTVVNNVDAPNFGSFAGGQGRAFTLRVRFAGRK
jgi:hypothetical protein